jgi:hypothetical protein
MPLLPLWRTAGGARASGLRSGGAPTTTNARSVAKKERGRKAMSRSFLRGIAVAFALAALLLCGRGQAEDYPTRPITIIVSLAAGTGMDTAVRLYG